MLSAEVTTNYNFRREIFGDVTGNHLLLIAEFRSDIDGSRDDNGFLLSSHTFVYSLKGLMSFSTS